jgi:hypothetical protein
VGATRIGRRLRAAPIRTGATAPGSANTESGKQAWLEISETGVHTGLGDDAIDFYLDGAQDAFDDLGRGFPFNRLVRQHRLTVGGDLRACVQNWLLLYALTRLTATLEI